MDGPLSTSGAATSAAGAENLDFARSVLKSEAQAVVNLADRLDSSFLRAVELMVGCADAGGNVLVTGLGKSGLMGAKIAATLSSLGIPSHTVHPTEAAHGDLGRFRPTDLVIAISNSGETDEVVNLAAILRQDGVPIISITNGPKAPELLEATETPDSAGGAGHTPAGQWAEGRSSLCRLSTVSLYLHVEDEAGTDAGFVAPTSSTTATAAIGDALALAVARQRNFTHADFARRHPGGSLGGLLRPVTEVLRFVAGRNLPLISDRSTVQRALLEASNVARRPGAILLVDERGVLTGIFTDGDLRRLILRNAHELQRPIVEVMTRGPRTLPDTAKVRDAVRMIREFRQDEIPVVDAAGKPVGILDVQDLIAMKLVKE